MKAKFYSSKVIVTAKSIDVARLPWVLYTEKRLLPTSGGIYFVGTDQKPTCYIGMTECFKKRFRSHHRKNKFEQRLEEFGQDNLKIRYWQAPPAPLSELITFLSQLEIYLIQTYRPEDNFGEVNPLPPPDPSIPRTYYGSIYVQLNQLSERYVERSVDGIAGFFLSAQKLHMAQSAVRGRSPAFMISSGSWEDALDEYGVVKREWKQYPTLYFLEMRFRSRWVKYLGQGGIEDYILSGDQAIFCQIFLNELPGFKEFSIQYLRTGLTNCSRSNFCETLLALTRKST